VTSFAAAPTVTGLVAASCLPSHEAVRLVQAASGLSRAALASAPALDPATVERFAALVERRRAGVPLQYLEGTAAFGPLELAVDGRALIPRPETEVLWDEAVRMLGEAGPGTVIVDLCTGSGNLALALKHAFPAAQVYATDLSAEALALAKENAARTGLDVVFIEGDLFDPLPATLRGRVDLLVANPPYVAESEVAALPAEVRDHEPRLALVAGPEGDEVLARIAADAYWWLGVGGWLLCEIGETQAARARDLFAALDTRIVADAAGRDRIVVGRRGAPCCR
jgi:release factor glutamine methyltransferase